MSKKRRSKVKHLGLNNKYHSKIKQEYMDSDYVSKLSEEEKQFLNDFNEEYYNANLDYKNLENNRFNKTKKDKKDCTDRNNARNRCVYGISKVSGKLDEEAAAKQGGSENVEDALINFLDSKKSEE